MIVTDQKALSKPCTPCESLNEGLDIGKKLLDVLQKTKDGVGLAANQIGISKTVCVVNVEKPIILVNPRIVGRFGKGTYVESCLSFPGATVATERWTNILIETLNNIPDKLFSYEKNPLECVCAQHEIDHLEGVTMFDRAKGGRDE